MCGCTRVSAGEWHCSEDTCTFFFFFLNCFLEGNCGLRLIVITSLWDMQHWFFKVSAVVFLRKSFNCSELMLAPSSWACYDSIGSRCYGRTGCLTRSLNVCFRWRTPKTMRKTSCKEKSRSGSPVEGLGRSTRGASARPSRTTWMPAATSRWVWSPSAGAGARRCAVGFPCAEGSWWDEMGRVC